MMQLLTPEWAAARILQAPLPACIL